MVLLAFSVPEAFWNTLAGALSGALFGGLMASAIVAYLTQKWIEKRERRNRRDDLRLKLYLDVVDLVLDNELALAKTGSQGEIPPVELQTKRFRTSHRLKLLASRPVREAYDKYRMLVFHETAKPVARRPEDPQEVVRARDDLIEAMVKDVQST